MPADTRPEYLTPPEIARLLRVGESKVSTWIKSGRLPAINVSSSGRPKFRIARQSLDEFLQRQSVTPAVQPARRQRRDSSIPNYV